MRSTAPVLTAHRMASSCGTCSRTAASAIQGWRPSRRGLRREAKRKARQQQAAGLISPAFQLGVTGVDSIGHSESWPSPVHMGARESVTRTRTNKCPERQDRPSGQSKGADPTAIKRVAKVGPAELYSRKRTSRRRVLFMRHLSRTTASVPSSTGYAAAARFCSREHRSFLSEDQTVLQSQWQDAPETGLLRPPPDPTASQ